MTQQRAVQKTTENLGSREITKDKRSLIDMDASVVNRDGKLLVALRREIGIHREKRSGEKTVQEFDTEEKKFIFEIPDISGLYSDLVESESLEFPSEILFQGFSGPDLGEFILSNDLQSFSLSDFQSSFNEKPKKVNLNSGKLYDFEKAGIGFELSINREYYFESRSPKYLDGYLEGEKVEITPKSYKNSSDEYNQALMNNSSNKIPLDPILTIYNDFGFLKEVKEPEKGYKDIERAFDSSDIGNLREEAQETYSFKEDSKEANQRLEFEVDQDFYQNLEGENMLESALMYLNDHGLDITIAEQPFYSQDSSENVSDSGDRGWKDSFHMIQSVGGNSTENMEVLVGDEDDLDFARNSIENIRLSEGDHFALDFSDDYKCVDLKETERERVRKKYENRYGVWIEDDWERGVYTSLVKNAEFYGSPLDISQAPNAREAYKSNFGDFPEEEFDNIVFGSFETNF